ncbi:hypothetical protein LZ009_09345 [Ramlibacter sp. XY19]|uniref:hypothetical protein n=1 Tax=Ramlibacter paludis TaxID=2908000 RepID=UPI0023DB6CA6|nr:hypothetical protein [Ramlibacter paludis]MCG2592984.1 hypothetical protein [Ramlibacter paludis]
MALDEGEQAQVQQLIDERLKDVVDKRVPRLVKLEQFMHPFILIGTLLVAVPGCMYGLYAFAQHYAEEKMKTMASDEKGPLANLNQFSSQLRETLSKEVDSATFKLLRYGCTVEDSEAAPNFDTCAALNSPAALQAQFAGTEDSQTISFAASPRQNVKLTLMLRPVDVQTKLKRVGLRLFWLPLDVKNPRNAAGRPIELNDEVVSRSEDRDFRVADSKGPILQLYGLKRGIEDQTLEVELNLTPALDAFNSNLHQIKVLTVPRPGSEQQLDGTERFFLRAVVSVNHRIH